MRGQDIHDVHVHGSSFASKVAVEWRGPDARYHFWLDASTMQPEETIYKNPIPLVKRGQPGFFDTRKLDAMAARWRPIVAAIMDVVKHRDLIGEWRREKEREQAEHEAQRRLAIRLRTVANHSGELLGALTACVAAMEAPGSGRHATALRRAKDLLAMLEAPSDA
jgi:hypothetical protein